MKFSKAAWNNVIIFSVMAMILLINVMDKEDGEELSITDSQPTLIAENSVILTLAVEEHALIERTGTSWQISPNLLKVQQLNQMILSWQQSEGSELLNAPDTSNANAQVVAIQIAGQETPLLFEFYWADEHLIVHKVNQQQWLIFPAAIFPQLLPPQLFDHE